jgi:hypothetical protein
VCGDLSLIHLFRLNLTTFILDLGGIDLLTSKLTSNNPKILARIGWGLVNLSQFSDFIRRSIGEKNGAMSLLLHKVPHNGKRRNKMKRERGKICVRQMAVS